jgi:uncharacterized SAM-binding protein YcdF (DUF218 family)
MESFSRWLDPLLLTLVAIGAGLFFRVRLAPSLDRRAKLALGVAAAGWAALWLASTPVVVYSLIRALELPPGDPVAEMGAADNAVAIIVLGAGMKCDPRPGVPLRECLNEPGNARIAGGARLFAAHPNAFIVLSGGPPIQAEASLDLALHEGVPRDKIEVEPASRNTRENASESMAIVKRRPPSRVVVVTSALHMRRALADFRRLGITPIAAPVDYLGRTERGVRPWFPDAVALGHFYRALHELLGVLKP